MNTEVFISFKNSDFSGNLTQDAEIAKALYEELIQRGVATFFSNSTLMSLGQSVYKRAIDEALDASKVLVLVSTDVRFIETEWVKYEWESFHQDILNGMKKNAQIVTYFDSFAREEIPRSLRDFQSFNVKTHTAKAVADFVQSILANVKSNPTEKVTDEQLLANEKMKMKSLLSPAKVRQSLYASDADKEFDRLRVQSKNTQHCDMTVLNELISKLPNDRPLWILDLGCAYNYVGNMRFSKLENVKVLGVDISQKCLTYAKEHSDCEKFTFRELNLETDDMEDKLQEIMLELGIEKFDIMFGALLTLHLKKPVSVLKRLRRFLSRDGYIMLRGSDDGSVLAVNDQGLVQKILEKCSALVGFSDRQNGRKLYNQLESAGYKDIKVQTFIKDTSGKDIDEIDEIFFERFSYRINNFRKIMEADPLNNVKRSDYLFMKYALEELEEIFTNQDFWYCEHDFIAWAKAR